MIRLTRSSPEPTALARKRALELPKARDAARAGGRRPDGERFTFHGYDPGKERLFADQHAKCAYCEMRQEQARFLDVDHYRPKSYYWWLAWSWDNLIFSCLHCNRTNKGDTVTGRRQAGAAPTLAEFVDAAGRWLLYGRFVIDLEAGAVVTTLATDAIDDRGRVLVPTAASTGPLRWLATHGP